MAKAPENEKDVKKQVKGLLDKHGWFWWMPPANGFGRTGIADILAVRKGVFLAIETKFGGNKPTPMQIAFLDSVRQEDAFGFVVCEKRLEWLQAWMESFDRAVAAASRQEQPAAEDGAMMLNAIREMTRELS